MKYIITYSNKIIDLTDREYEKLCPVIEDPSNRFCQIKGQTYNINDFKYIGDKKKAPTIQGWNDIPAQQAYENNGLGAYFLKGDTKELENRMQEKNGLIWRKYTPEQFREFAIKIRKDHQNRMIKEFGIY